MAEMSSQDMRLESLHQDHGRSSQSSHIEFPDDEDSEVPADRSGEEAKTQAGGSNTAYSGMAAQPSKVQETSSYMLQHIARVIGCGVFCDCCYNGDLDLNGTELNDGGCSKPGVPSALEFLLGDVTVAPELRERPAKAKAVMQGMLRRGNAPSHLMDASCTWSNEELEAKVEYGCRKLTAFQFSIMRNRKDVAEKVLSKVPEARRKAYLTQQLRAIECDCSLYEGETIIHFAVMHAAQQYSAAKDTDLNQKIDENTTLRYLLELLPEAERGEVLRRQASGLFYTRGRIPSVLTFIDLKRNFLNAGATPLALAVSMQSRRVVNYMLEIDYSLLHHLDIQNNNVLHRLAAQMKRHKHDEFVDGMRLQEMFKFLMKREEMFYPDNRQLLVQRNIHGYRPIHVATKNGNVAMFEAIVSSPSVRTELVDYDTMKLVAYNLEDLDTVTEREDGYHVINVLDIAVASRAEEALEIFQETPMAQLIDIKWQTYGTVGFTYFFLINAVYLIALSCAVHYRPLMYSVCSADIDPERERFVRNETLPDGEVVNFCTPWIIKPFRESYRTTGDYWRLFAELVVILVTLLHCFSEVRDFFAVADMCPPHNGNPPGRTRRLMYSFGRLWDGSMGRSGAFSLIKWLTIILAAAAVGMRVTDSESQDIILSLLIYVAYLYTTVFARDFKFSGPYLIAMYKILTTIITRFIILYLFTLMSFGSFLYVLFQEAQPEPPEHFSSYGTILLNLYSATLGLHSFEYKVIRSPHVAALVTIFLFLFFLFTVILFLNFLIALMSDIQAGTLESAKLIWRRQVVASLFMVERRLPSWLPFYSLVKQKVGLRGGRVLLDQVKVDPGPNGKQRELRYLIIHEPDAAVPQSDDEEEHGLEQQSPRREPGKEKQRPRSLTGTIQTVI